MIHVDSLIDLKIEITSSKEISLCDLTEENTILSWNGKDSFVTSNFDEVKLDIVDFTYIIEADGEKVILSEDQGFWQKDGSKLKPSDVTPNKTQVYLKKGNSIIKSQVQSIEKVYGQSIVYSLINTVNHNYVLNGFILHNFDVQDYVSSKIIGVGNVEHEISTISWLDMYYTSNATRDAFEKAFNELIHAIISVSVRWDDTSTISLYETYLTDFTDKWEDAFIKGEKFWNSVIPPNSKRTGIQNYDKYKYVPFLLDGSDPLGTGTDFARADGSTINFEYDLTGTDTFDPQYWYDYQTALKEMTVSIKRFLAISTGFYSGENDYPGTIPPIGFSIPSY
jgi:hypothetical protein